MESFTHISQIRKHLGEISFVNIIQSYVEALGELEEVTTYPSAT
jgi:hypothetical protein